ncbi:co-chaperone HscB [Dongshaea marina]|uniref:co-chaperone HscB n=1 Tax=Dongshaea marina TaxID=2047966 RepID=UPI000D3E8B9F|nr:co-chaperone HscB [Dongshaea marina]
MNYFELFGFTEDFEIDKARLAALYRQLQSRFHPDKFAAAPANERLIAVQRAAEINDGYQTLSSPLRRAEYLLSLRGIDLKSEQQTLRDPAFLMQQMEWREKLAEIAHHKDPEQSITDFETLLSDEFLTMQQQFVAFFSQQQYSEAADMLRKLKFIDKLQQELEQLADKLFEI